MNVALGSLAIFGGLTLGNGGILIASTYAQCSKTNIVNSFKNGAIAAAPPAIIYFLAAFFEFIRKPFVNFFMGFGVEDPIATRIALGYIVMLLLWPMTVWAVHDATSKACVATPDEMTSFKAGLLAKLNEKRNTKAANTTPPPK
jgi:hypothetical protein